MTDRFVPPNYPTTQPAKPALHHSAPIKNAQITNVRSFKFKYKNPDCTAKILHKTFAAAP